MVEITSDVVDRPDVSRKLVLAPRPRKLPDVLSIDGVARLIEAAPDIRYRAALGVPYGAGLRVSEVAHLRADDIDSRRMLIRIEAGKDRKDRNAMLSPQLLELLRPWWHEGKRRSILLPHGWLFPGRSCTDPISTRQLHRAVHEAADAAGIRKRVSPHTLRHSFAMHLLEQDVDIASSRSCWGRASSKPPRSINLFVPQIISSLLKRSAYRRSVWPLSRLRQSPLERRQNTVAAGR